jgi:hypothetical protein
MKAQGLLLWCGCLAAWMLVTGCGKKEEAEAPAPATAEAEPPAAAEAAPEPASDTPPAPVVDAAAAFAEQDRAMRNKDFEAAADAMIRLQMSNVQMTEQQAYDQVNRMRDLSKQIADAYASGDPKAIRAAEMMRQAQRMRTGR